MTEKKKTKTVDEMREATISALKDATNHLKKLNIDGIEETEKRINAKQDKVSAKPDDFKNYVIEKDSWTGRTILKEEGVVSPKAEDDFNPLDECEGCVYKIYATKSCPPETVISKGKIRSLIQELDFCNLIHQARTDKMSLFEAQRQIKEMMLRGLLENKDGDKK
jgi:hypothetical protein